MLERTHKEVISLQRVRLASRQGPVVIVEPSVPTSIPAALFLEAAKNGCVDYSPEMIDAFTAALERASSAPKPAAAAPPKAVDLMSLAKDAVRQVLIAAQKSPELLTSGGLPRLPAVRVAFERTCVDKKIKTPDFKITSDLIAVLTADIQDESKPAAAAVGGSTVQRYPAGVIDVDLEGEEVGGIDQAALEGIDNSEE